MHVFLPSQRGLMSWVRPPSTTPIRFGDVAPVIGGNLSINIQDEAMRGQSSEPETSFSAVASPMPVAPPVMTATLPSSNPAISHFLLLRVDEHIKSMQSYVHTQIENVRAVSEASLESP